MVEPSESQYGFIVPYVDYWSPVDLPSRTSQSRGMAQYDKGRGTALLVFTCRVYSLMNLQTPNWCLYN